MPFLVIFKKIKISIANCEKTKKDILKPMHMFVEHNLRSVLSNFGPKKVKGLGGYSFSPVAFFETFQQTLAFFGKFFLILLRAFRIYMVIGV